MSRNHVQVLRMARARIALKLRDYQRGTHEQFICTALLVVRLKHPEFQEEVRELRALISERLDGEMTLGAWLCERGYLSVERLRRVESSPKLWRKLQVTRLAWIDSLIEEYSK